MVGDTVHHPCQVGSLGSLENKVNSNVLYTGPYISPTILSNSVIVGDTVRLPCKVDGLGNLESKVNPKGCTPDPTFPLPSSPHALLWWGDTVHLPCQPVHLPCQPRQPGKQGESQGTVHRTLLLPRQPLYLRHGGGYCPVSTFPVR